MKIYNAKGVAVNDVCENKWLGKSAGFLGDSITEAGASTTGKAFFKYIESDLGFSECVGYGISASTISDMRYPMCDRYADMSSNHDVVFVFGGTNDFHFGVPLGEWYTVDEDTRTLNTDSSTFRGALNKLCLGLIDKYVGKNVILLTPTHRYTFNSQATEFQKNRSGIWFEEYVQCIREASSIFSIPLIDLYAESGLFPYVQSNATKYFEQTSGDKLHPNTAGHARMAKVIERYLKNMEP